MGAIQSLFKQPQPPHTLPTSAPHLPSLLRENTYYPTPHSPYPYHLIQLSETSELPYKSHLISDALVHHIRAQPRPYTHLILHTHGWNTTPQKAIAIPFTQFLGGMQNDAAMPRDHQTFRPLFVAVIWPGLPTDFAARDDALTRLQLIEDAERDAGMEHSDVAEAASAARHAIERGDPDDDAMMSKLRDLAAHARDTGDDGDDGEQGTAAAAAAAAEEEVTVLRDRGTDFGWLGEAVVGVAARVLGPLEYLVFRRVAKRAERVGAVLGAVVGKLMRAQEGERMRVCASGNSIAAHVLGSMAVAEKGGLAYKLHTVFYVQAAVERALFEDGGRFEGCRATVAGPVVCSYSRKDRVLGWMFEVFYDEAVGYFGFAGGERLVMKGLEEKDREPYVFANGDWNSVDGTEFIDEGAFLEGGHGDFKEDVTTSMYWAAITADVDDDAYDL